MRRAAVAGYEVCVCYLTRVAADGRREVLLGRKRTGLGLGKIVGPGGKVELGEVPETLESSAAKMDQDLPKVRTDRVKIISLHARLVNLHARPLQLPKEVLRRRLKTRIQGELLGAVLPLAKAAKVVLQEVIRGLEVIQEVD